MRLGAVKRSDGDSEAIRGGRRQQAAAYVGHVDSADLFPIGGEHRLCHVWGGLAVTSVCVREPDEYSRLGSRRAAVA